MEVWECRIAPRYSCDPLELGVVEQLLRVSGVANTGVVPPTVQALAALHPNEIDLAVQ
jgi:hypothetical protein